jgi:AcrR family transcriptional regulator
MSPRPRKVTDEDVFAAAHRAMTQIGAGELTLGHIAAEAGVTAGALVQRFGSKRDLLLKISAGLADWIQDMFAQLQVDHRSPLAALRAYADCIAQMGEGPGGLAHHLGYLQIDLGDPDFHRHVKAQARMTRRGIRDLLDAAVTARELLPSTDTASLARTVEAIVGGSLFAWAFYREGRATDWVRRDLEAVLRPHLAASRDNRRTKARAGR